MDTEQPRSRQEAEEKKAERPAPPYPHRPVARRWERLAGESCLSRPAYARLAWKCKSTGSMGTDFSSKYNTKKKYVPGRGIDKKDWTGRAVGHASLTRPHVHTRRASLTTPPMRPTACTEQDELTTCRGVVVGPYCIAGRYGYLVRIEEGKSPKVVGDAVPSAAARRRKARPLPSTAAKKFCFKWSQWSRASGG
ncbi:hypothetical protein CGRA01v4_11930 [Colletotrichum graminicola]|nr:hypothetical protein CGRA01v4_11930 [Colletotrichum graminicola]